MAPVLALALTGVAVLAAWPLTRALGRAAGWPLAALYLAGAAVLVPEVFTVTEFGPRAVRIPWVPSRGWTLDLRLDLTALLFALLALVIGAIVLAYSTSYLGRSGPDGEPVRHYGFYQLMTVFTLAMLGLVLGDSLVLLYICWELTSLASFGLIANSGRSAFGSAVRTLAVTFAGGLALLAAVVLVAVRVGTDSLSAALAADVWTTDSGFTATVAVLVALAAMTKSAQFPFHFWLPDAMAAATPVSAYLHAAAVVKAGIFLLLRFSPALHSSPVWAAVLVPVGMGTAIMAALFALQKTDLKQLLAYSTVSQLGWIVAAIGVGTQAAIVAAAVHTLAHALFKSGLFMLAGVVDHQAGTRDVRRLGPLWRRMPWTFGACVVAAAGMAGIPPTLGFVSKESMLTAFGDVGAAASPFGTPSSWAPPLLLAAAVVGAVLTVGYSARIVFGGFVDGPRDVSDVHEAPVRLWLPAALPAVAGLPLVAVVGGLDAPMTTLAREAAGPWGPEPAAGESVRYGLIPEIPVDELFFEAHLSLWHGFTTALWLTAVVLAAAAVLVWRRRAVSARLEGRELLPVTGAGLLEGLIGRVVVVGRVLVRPTATDSPHRHAGALVATVAAVGLGTGAWALFSGTALPARTAGQDRPIDAVLLGVVTIAVLGLCSAPSRIGAVVLLSAVGIAVTVQMFALGAPDVGMTQLLVEALSIIVFMMVLRRLPGTFVRPGRRRRRTAIVLAVVSGAAAALAAFVFTARRERSPLGEYLLRSTYDLAGGHNVVNVVLVEFRALDTLGEVSVLGMAGLAILAVVRSVRPDALDPEPEPTVALPLWVRRPAPSAADALADPHLNSAPLRLLTRGVTPVLLLVSAMLLLRGHDAPGGGFIAALVASCALALVYLSRPQDDPLAAPSRPYQLVAAGLLLAGGTGVAGYLLGGFLDPAHGEVAGNHVSSAMVFDLGVFAAVIGLVVAAVDTLGTGGLHPSVRETPAPRPRDDDGLPTDGAPEVTR